MGYTGQSRRQLRIPHYVTPALVLLVGLMGGPDRMASAQGKPGQQITAENWGEKVGFKPDLTHTPARGTRIAAANWHKYKQWIPRGIDLLVSKYNLKIDVIDYQPVHPSIGYIAATNRYGGQPKLIKGLENPRKRGLENYVAGLPFPAPKSGRELAYNYALAYRGDDGKYHYGVFWISASSGVERWEEWEWRFINRVQFRTDLKPIPAFSRLKAKGIAHLSLTRAIAPHDKRGFVTLYQGTVEPEDVKIWIYLPTARRIMRMSVGTSGDSWNSTDLLYEDIGGYAGHPEWMNWKIIARATLLAPVHAGLPHGKSALKEVFDFKSWPHWNLRARWEPRPVYVVQATPRLPDYPYSRMLVYFDAETFHIPIKVAFDRKGELWKVIINASNASPDMHRLPLKIGTTLAVDLQAKHATAFPAYGHRSNVGYHPRQFTIARLRKMGR